MTPETPAPRNSLIGRKQELGRLCSALHATQSGAGRLILIAGEPGIGKTRLCEELTGRVGEVGNASVVWGRCYEGEGAPAFWPWAQILLSLVRRLDGEQLRVALGTAAGDLVHLAPLIRERVAGLPQTAIVESPEARAQLFNGVASFLGHLASRAPLVVVLDDLQGADRSSLLLLQFLVANSLREHRILVIGTYRDVALSPTHPLTHSLFELGREPGVDHMQLQGLSQHEVAGLIEAALHASTRATNRALTADVIETIHAQTEGNPLFVHEYMELLLSNRLTHGAWRAGTHLPVPPSIKTVIGRRLALLSPPCLRLLRLATVIGREFSRPILQAAALAVSPKDGDDTERIDHDEALTEAIRARVLLAIDADHFRFSHALIRETLYGQLNPTDRALLHRHVGRALEHAADIEERLVELVHHYSQAGGGEAMRSAIGYAQRAADHAIRLLAYEEAAHMCDVGLSLVDRLAEDDDADCYRLLLMLTNGLARTLAGETSRAREVFLRAVDIARGLGAAHELARAVLGYLWVNDSSFAGPGAPALLAEALDTLPAEDSAIRVELMGTLASQAQVTTDREQKERGARLAAEALSMARRLGDPKALASALRSWFYTGYGPDSLDERSPAAEELFELGTRLRDPCVILDGLFLRATSRFAQGDMGAFDGDAAAFAATAHALRQPRWLWRVPLIGCARAIVEGRLTEAEKQAELLLREGQRAEEPDAIGLYWAHLFNLRALQGRLGEVPGFESTTRQLVEVTWWNAAWHAGLASGLVEIGRLDTAAVLFERMAAGNFSGLLRDSSFLVTVGFLSSVCTELRDARRATVLYEMLLPYRDRYLTQLTFVFTGPAARYLGLLASTMGRWDEAIAHFERALVLCAHAGANPFAALVQYECAKALLDRGASTDVPRAVNLLEQSIAASRRMGVGMRLRQAETLIQRCRGEAPDVSRQEPAVAIAAKQSLDPRQIPQGERQAPDDRPQWVFESEDRSWTLAYASVVLRLADTKGLHYIAHLLRHPGRDFSAHELARCGADSSRQASGGADSKGEARMEDSTRARSAVTQRIRQVVKKLKIGNPDLARHLSRAISTGSVCRYDPGTEELPGWQL